VGANISNFDIPLLLVISHKVIPDIYVLSAAIRPGRSGYPNILGRVIWVRFQVLESITRICIGYYSTQHFGFGYRVLPKQANFKICTTQMHTQISLTRKQTTQSPEANNSVSHGSTNAHTDVLCCLLDSVAVVALLPAVSLLDSIRVRQWP
jgi:hypothetical protein